MSKLKLPKQKLKRLKTYLQPVLTVILMLAATHAFAGTDGGELQPAAQKVAGLISGWGGKLICMVSLLLGVLGSAMRFNPYLVAGFFGTCLFSALGVAIVNSSVTALI